MILIITKNFDLADNLRITFTKHKVNSKIIPSDKPGFLEEMYKNNVTALVIDKNLHNLPQKVSEDILNSFGRRIPVIALENTTRKKILKSIDKKNYEEHHFIDAVTLLQDTDFEGILSTLGACGALSNNKQKMWRRSIPYYNHQIPIKMLKKNGSLGVLTIDASGFRDIEIEYGTEVFAQVRKVFQQILDDLWGKTGSFRESDVLCRKSQHGNIYYVFLNRSVISGTLPLPGVMEEISDRLHSNIQNALWADLNSKKGVRRLPACLDMLPSATVGYSSAIFNPCLDPGEIVETLLENSLTVAKIQESRIKLRQRELMYTLIQGEQLLYPYYQAVFKLQGITKDLADKAANERSIAPLVPFLYGFESLIRVQSHLVKSMIGDKLNSIDPEYLRPDILFSIAKLTNVSLELDQACLRHAFVHAKKLPGYLMVNILPQNFYFLNELEDFYNGYKKIIFEVAESEAISNAELMIESLNRTKKRNYKIAADDFGKGFAGLDRIIQIQPDVIKFDRSIISNIHNDPIKQAYVSGLVKATNILKTSVLAEGVETWEEAEILQQMGVQYIQGFLLHRPQPINTLLPQVQEAKENDKNINVA